jgi:hypothetical protein
MGGTEPPCWGLDPWDLTSWQRQCRPTKRDGNLGTPKPALAYGGHTSTFDLTGRNGQTNPLKVAGDMRSWDVQPSRTTERWEAGEDRAGHARQPLLGVGILSDTMAPLPAKLSTTLSLLLENSAHYSSPLYRGSLEPSPSEGQPRRVGRRKYAILLFQGPAAKPFQRDAGFGLRSLGEASRERGLAPRVRESRAFAKVPTLSL